MKINCKNDFGIYPKSKMCRGKVNLNGDFEVTFYSSSFRSGNNTLWYFLCDTCNEYNTYTPDEVRKLKGIEQ